MRDVQLLVTHQHAYAVPCAIDELGELYGRAGGLADGYSDAAPTAE
jgi:L-aminoadipate-semialdehyde dehydrogenase